MDLIFESGCTKAASNLAKHAVSFQEALSVFGDPMASVFDDEDHSVEEQWKIIIGHSFRGNLLIVCFTAQGECVRLSVRGEPREEGKKTMRKASTSKWYSGAAMRREYHFDSCKARPNRFAPLMKGRSVAILLDPDVAPVFESSESVNTLLRSVINALP